MTTWTKLDIFENQLAKSDSVFWFWQLRTSTITTITYRILRFKTETEIVPDSL